MRLNKKQKTKKDSNAKKRKKIKINKKTVIFSSTVLLSMLALILIIYFIALRFRTFHVIQYDGYAISEQKLTEKLYNINSETTKEIKTVELPEQTILYKSELGIFAGEEQKVNVNIEYPIYSNNKTALLMLADNYSLITTDYETVEGYKGITLVRGVAYNYSDSQRADNNQYIFIQNEDNIFCNVHKITIKTANREYTIPENSIIYFTKTFISYYALEGENLEYYLIDDIDLGNTISMNQETYDYETFLKKIGVIGINTENQNIIEEGPDNNETNNNTQVNNTQTSHEQTDDEKNEDDNQDQENNGQIQYVKPEIHINSYQANVYTLKLDCSIYDPTQRVTTPIIVTIYQGENIYLRKQITTSGTTIISDLHPNTEYRILVQYQYKNEEDQTVEKTILDKSVTTKTREELTPIELSWENGAVSTNKITLEKLKILNDLSEESVLGIIRASILFNGEITYTIPTYQIRELMQGKEITVETTDLLESNQKIEYEIHFYDIENEKIKIKNNKGNTTTSSQKPEATIQLVNQDITNATLKITLQNKDKVNVSNYHISVFTLQGDFIRDIELDASKNEQNVVLNELNRNEYYVAQVYGTYTLEGMETIENDVMDKVQFTTKPISALGYLTISAQNTEQTDNKLTYRIKIDSIATNAELILYLHEFTVSIMQGEEEIEQKSFSEEELERLKNGELMEISFEKLNSNTQYNLNMNAKLEVGGILETVTVVQQSTTTVKTLKKAPTVEVKDQFVTENMIDMDVRLIDEDNAIEGDTIRVEVTDERGRIISVDQLLKGQDFQRYTYSPLEENKVYTLTYIADQYNISDSNATYETNKVLRTIQIKTESGISGSLKLENLLRKPEGKNLADMKSTVKWETLFFNNSNNYLKEYNEQENTLTLGINGATRYYSYDLTDYIGEDITISFQAKSTYRNNNIYLITQKEGGTTQLLTGINTSNWTDYEFTVKNESGYVGFYTVNNGIIIKDLQIELGTQRTNYEEYKSSYYSDFMLNLVDAKNEITNKDYYFRIYQGDTLIINEHYTGFEDSNTVQNTISKKLEDNKSYRAELVIVIREREYVIDTCEFTVASEETKGIGTIDEFRWLQVDGNYIFTNNIDLTDATETNWFCANELKGHLNFNGYSLTKGTKTQRTIFDTIGETAIIENMVFNVDFSNATSGYLTYTRPLFENNYGTIQNIQINFIGTKDAGNTEITLLGTNNYGTISNFVIHLQEKIYCTRKAGMICISNEASGVIRNGYAYGENIQATYPIYTDEWKDVGVFTYINTGIIENVYSLVTVETREQTENIHQNIGNIIGLNYGIVRNSYSVGYGYQNIYNAGPGVAFNSNTIENVYYFTKNYTFNSTQEIRAPYYALENVLFQNTILNSNQGFNTDSLISLGYYPHVNLPSCMETQEYISLPVSIEEREIGILYNQVVESTDNSAIVDVTITNKTGETFKSVEVKDADSTIISQNYEDGISTVRIKVDNPRRYISNYSILAIETEDFFGIEGIRKEYQENVQVIKVDFYKPISSIEDWKQINNSPTENYKLYADLDFAEEGDSICITKTITGILDGNGHTIKNIILPEDTTNTLFSTLEGSLLNLNIDNYYLKTKNLSRLGVITYTAGKESKVIGCNFKNIYLDNNNTNAINPGTSYYMGVISTINTPTTGIATALINNTVSNITIISTYSHTITAGGLVGYVTNETETGEISNCYIQNCNIQVTGASTSNGVGALAGLTKTQTVTSCYAIGTIQSNTTRLGGLIGQALSCQVSQCYANVNLISDNTYMGGVIGVDNNATASHNLALGDLYTTVNNATTSNIKRCYANRNNADYAYDEQKINGATRKDLLLGASQLLTREQLSNANTYINIIQMGNGYDYSEVSKGILPKLYYKGTTNLLPGQEDNTLIKDKDFSLESITPMRIDQQSFRVTGNIVIPNDNIQITGIEIENTNVEVENIYKDNGVYKFQVKATVEQYLDSYQITKIYYLEDGEQKEQEMNYKIDMIFYKEIPNVEEWQKIDPELKQNYRITGNINFENITNPVIEVKAGRIYADQPYTISNLTISNATSLIKEISYNIENLNFENITINNNSINHSTGVIATNYGTANNLNFDNINITSKYENAGPIGKQVQSFTNLSSNNVTVVSTSSFTGGIIGRAIPIGNNLTVQNATITARSYVGGAIGYGSANNVTGSFNKIKGTANYTGGLFGSGTGQNLTYTGTYTKENPSDTPDVIGNRYVGGIAGTSGTSASNYNITDAWIQGTERVGGLVGDLYFKASSATHIKVEGVTNVGGLGGVSYSNGSTGQISTIEDSIIIGTNYVGGVFGQGCMTGTYDTNVSVSNCTIEGDNYVGGIGGSNYSNGIITAGHIYNSTIGKSNSNYVGTIVGKTGGSNASLSVRYSYAENCTVIGNSNIGGIAGSSEYGSNAAAVQAICYNYNNSIIRASGNNVGGIVGNLKQGSVYENYNNAQIICTGNNVGGIVGYLDNSRMQVDTEGNGTVLNQYISRIYNNYVARTTISGGQNVGGVIGAVSTLLINSYIENGVEKYNYEKNYVDAELYSVDENSISMGIGNKLYDAELDSQLRNTYIYRFSKMNNTSVADMPDNYYIKNNYNFVSSQLKQQETYTQILGWNSTNYDYSSLANNQYPILKSITGQIGITLPEDDAVVANTASITMAITKSRTGDIIYQKIELPEIICYPVSASEINLEFSNANSNLYFTYSINNQEASTPIKLTKRTYTFQYDYKNVITIEISNGAAADTFVIDPTNNVERVAKVQDEYFYLIGNTLSSNKRVVEGEFVHIYGDKALSTEGYLYDLKTLSKSNEEKVEPFKLEKELKALGEYEFNNKTILNFAKYSVIKDGDNSIERETQIFVKNGKLEILDSRDLNIVPNKIIIDYYNNNEYQTVLGTNGVLYNLKNNIQFPKELSNEKIESITNNLEEEDNVVVIYYKTGRVCAFDYITGEIKFDNQVKADISFWEYLNGILEETTEQDEQLEKIQETYQQSLEVKDKLIEMPLTQQTTITAPEENTNSQGSTDSQGNMGSQENTGSQGNTNTQGNTSQNTAASSVTSSKSYVSVYDSDRKEYVVYKVDEVLDATSKEVVSENTKIEMQGLDSIYYKSAKQENVMTNKGIFYIGICIILVIIALNILARRTSNNNINKKKRKVHKK